MPERDILKSDDRVAAQQSRHAADALRQNRVPFVRHRRRTLLPLLELLLRLTHLRSLPVTNLQSELVERRRDDGERRQILRVDVALYDLRRDGRGLQSKTSADSLFNFRVEVRERADRAAYLPRGYRRARSFESRAVAPRLVVPERERHAERSRLGVHAVRASNLRRGAKLERAALQHLQQRPCFFQQHVARVAQQKRVGRVHNVRGREAVVYEARGVADTFGEGGSEGDHVVVGRPLDFAYALDVEGGLPTYLLDRLARNRPHLGVDFAHGQLNVEPLLKLVLLRPESAHFGQRVAFNHSSNSSSKFQVQGSKLRPVFKL